MLISSGLLPVTTRHALWGAKQGESEGSDGRARKRPSRILGSGGRAQGGGVGDGVACAPLRSDVSPITATLPSSHHISRAEAIVVPVKTAVLKQ